MSHGEDKLRYLEKISWGGGGGGGGGQQFDERKNNKRKESKNNKRKEKEKKKQSCPKIFTVFRRPEFGSPRIKVGLFKESYE